eukprot:UN33653
MNDDIGKIEPVNLLPDVKTPEIPKPVENEVEKKDISDTNDGEEDSEVLRKRNAIKQSTITGYRDFRELCWGKDELWPIGKKCHNWVNMGLTTIDTLDTLWIMGFKEEYYEAVEWVQNSFTLPPNKSVSFFETVIRCLGGLLSAYGLSGDKILLDKAIELGDGLFPAFDTPTGLPMGSINLKNGKKKNPSWSGGGSLLAEIGTIQLEFGYLSEASGDPKYKEKAYAVFDNLDPTQNSRLPALRIKGQYPLYISPQDFSFKTSHISWGAMGDSFYEYLLKLYIITGKTNETYKRMYLDSVEGMLEHLWVDINEESGYVAEMRGSNLT